MTDLDTTLAAAGFAAELFDRIPEVVFFVKDAEGRYRLANATLVARCGLESKNRLIGRTAVEVFPSPLGVRYLEQDRSVIASGIPIIQRLELHLYPDRLEGWCLTDKIPLLDSDGAAFGVAGISRDLHLGVSGGVHSTELARAVEIIRSQVVDPPSVAEVAARVGLSVFQLNHRLKRLLGITARQLLTKARVDSASELLRSTSLAIGDVAQRSGYFDQSAFARQFRSSTGLTPRQYRERHRGDPGAVG